MEQIEERFGGTFFDRASTIERLLKGSETSFPLEVMGKYRHLKQISVRIELPVYRISNGRTRTLQKEYIAEKKLPDDYFQKDEYSSEIQKSQHEILKRLINEESLLKTFQNKTQQTEPLIITQEGIVVNGNRRLCAWRELYYSDKEKYKHLSSIDVAVLPPECDENEIRNLEKRLQIQKPLKAEYKWHSKAMMMRDEENAKTLLSEIAKAYGISQKDVRLQIDALNFAEDFLKSIGQKDRWSQVNSYEYAFIQLAKFRRAISDEGKKEFFQALCYSQFKEGIQNNRLYETVKDIANNLDRLFEVFSQQRQHIFTSVSPKDTGDDIGILLNGEQKQNKYSLLARSIHDNPIPNIGETIQDVIQEQQAIEKEIQDSQFLINSLSRISNQLTNLLITFSQENNYNLEGTEQQLDTIDHSAQQLKSLIKQKKQ